MPEQPFYERLSETLMRKGLYDPQLDGPELLKRSFSAEQLKSLNDVTASFYQRIMDDERLETFHPLFSDGKKIRFQKDLTRFTLFLMTLSYEEFLPYVFKTMIRHNGIGLDMHILMEYFFVWNNDVTKWCCTHFDHEKPAILARSQKMNVLAFLFISGYDKAFMEQFEESSKADGIDTLEGHSELISEHMEEIDRLLGSTLSILKVDYLGNILTDITKLIAASQLHAKAIVVKMMNTLTLFIKKHPEQIARHPASGILFKDIIRWLDHYSTDIEQKLHSRRFYLTGMTMEVELFKAYMVRYDVPIAKEAAEPATFEEEVEELPASPKDSEG